MNDIDDGVDFDGPEPEHLRPFPDALSDLPPSTPEDEEQIARRFFEKLDAVLLRRRREESLCATGAPLAPAPVVRRVEEDGVTVRSPTFDERPAAPPPPAEPLPLPVAAREPPRPAVVLPPEVLTTTELPLEIPGELREQMGRWPFRPRPPGEDLDRTMLVPVLKLSKVETEPVDDAAVARAAAVLPFVRSPVGAEVVQFPPLSLEQYASLRAELSVWPERWAEILLRYQVMNEAARRALDEHWQMQLAASPEARAMFEKAVAVYTAWLRTPRV